MGRWHDPSRLRAAGFLARLAALTPRPRINLIFYHGLLAPHARSRAAVVDYGRPRPTAPIGTSETVSTGTDHSAEAALPSGPPRRASRWAELMRRAFDFDVLTCPRCGGRLRLIALILDPRTIRSMLLSLAVPPEVGERAPPAVVVG